MKPSSADPSLIPLQQQLQIIDRAIEIIATEKDLSPGKLSKSQHKGPQSRRSAPSSSSLLNSQSLSHLIVSKNGTVVHPVEDESFKIQTMSIETVTCPHCLQQVEMKGFKLHESQLCTNKIVTCPNAGCQATMHASSLQFHLQEECLIAKQRREILQRAAQRLKEKERADEKRKQEEILRREEALRLAALREKQLQQQQKQSLSQGNDEALAPPPAPIPTSVLCSQCGEAVRDSQLAYHTQKTCHFRLIMCPNYGNGCNDRKIPYALLNQHLQEKCPAEMLRAQLIAKSRQRQELVQCSTCGEMVTLAKWRRHEVELCANRLVPCRNHSLGCPCMLPLKERHLHEHIDEGYERFTCYLPGSGSHLAIDEGDIVSPWTAEFWLYRPHATESLKQYIINMLLLLPAYESSFAVEMRAHRRIMKIVLALKDESSNNHETSEMVKKMDKNERKLWQKAQAEQKVAWVNELTTMIPVYTDAMLGYLQAFQNLAINVEAGIAAARDVKFYSNPTWDADTLISLQSDYPGRVAEPKQELGSFAVALGETVSSSTSSPSSRQNSSKHHHRPHKEKKGGVNIDGVIMEENESDLMSVNSCSLLTGEDMDSTEVSITANTENCHTNDINFAKDAMDATRNSSSPNYIQNNVDTNLYSNNNGFDSRKLPTLTKDDLERIVSLWQGESHICKLFQFAFQSITLEDLQIQESKEQTVFENLQLAQEAEMTMLEENHKLWLLKEEDKERRLAEEMLREKERLAKEAEGNDLIENQDAKEENLQKEDNQVDNDTATDLEENKDNKSPTEDTDEETNKETMEMLGQQNDSLSSPETLVEASAPELETYPLTLGEINEEKKQVKDNIEAAIEEVDYFTKREAKTLYPDYWETGGANRLILFRRALEKERLLVRETHIHEISTQLKRLEEIQAKKTEMEMAYTRFVDELIDLLGASFASLQNTQQFLYQFLHAPVSILFPATAAQMEAFQREVEREKQSQNGTFLPDIDDILRHNNPIFANIAESKRITAHTIDDWIGLFQCMARLLKRDFDTLQKLRIAAGLLTPEAKKKRTKKESGGIDGDNGSETASVKHQKTEEELEKAAKRKEKEKLRRELRKNKKALEQEEEESSSPTTETKKSSNDNISVNKPTSKDVKIITRTSELLRAGCGAEILAEAATVNKDGNRCRLISSMFSGLSILTMEFDDTLAQTHSNRPSSSNKNLNKSTSTLENGGQKPSEIGEQGENDDEGDDEEEKEKEKNDPHYELLLSKADFQKLSSFGGQVGLIFAPTSSVMSLSNGKKTNDNKKQALMDSLGTQAVMYNCKIMRGKWTHLVYVSQPSSIATPSSSSHKKKRPRKPLKKASNQNFSSANTSNLARILLYMDGQYIGSQRDCAMALPMLSLAGSPWSLQSFCGVLLDVRLWARPRSGQQIAHFAHRLMTLSPIVVTHSGSSLNAPIDYHAQPAGSDGKESDHIAEDAGLIAWWTFDDGPGCSVVTDVTRHRFKTPLNYSVITSKSVLLGNGPEMTTPDDKNADTENTTANGVGSVVVRTWDWRHEPGDPSRYPAPHELLQEYIEHVVHLAIAKQVSLPVYLGYHHETSKNRDILYQVVPVSAPTMVLAVAVSSVQNKSTIDSGSVCNNNSRPSTSDGVKTSRPATSRTTTTINTGYKNTGREGLNSRNGERANANPPVVMTFLPQPRFVLTMPFHVQNDSSRAGLSKGNFSMLTTRTTASGRAGSSQNNTGRRMNRGIGGVLTTWMQKIWSRLRRHHWLCAETIPVFAIASANVLSPSEEKENKAKDMQQKLIALMKANKIPTKEEIRQKELKNKKKKTPQLPYYLMEEHKLRAANAENLNILPIPSFREQNLCLFELRRHRLAKQGRLLYSTVPCPLECGAMQIQKRQLRHHLQHICPKRMIHCRFFAYCDALFPAELQEFHEEHSCNYVQRFSHAKFWAERAQWTKEHLRPCPDCNELVVVLSPEQEEQLKKDILRLKAKQNTFKANTTSSVSKRFAIVKAKIDLDFEAEDENDENENDSAEEENSDNKSLQRAEEQYRRSWVYHKEFACLYRKVFCPRPGCAYAKPDPSHSFVSSPTSSPPTKEKTADRSDALENRRQETELQPSVLPPPRLPFHALQYHLDHDCGGYEVQQRCIVIERARSRHPYPRPWGISISVPKVLDATTIDEMENAPLGETENDQENQENVDRAENSGEDNGEEEDNKSEEDSMDSRANDEQEDVLMDV